MAARPGPPRRVIMVRDAAKNGLQGIACRPLFFMEGRLLALKCSIVVRAGVFRADLPASLQD
jgi:hypothetical protein